tara:strand:- start:299 stop:637 length:339 start_codon:yes stop_codon:yes gene_type:complete
MNCINWEDFKKVEIRVGTIIEALDFPEAIKPAYKLKIDLGSKIGIKNSSAQITELYSKDELIDQQVLVVVNLNPKKIGPFISECLVTGFYKNNKDVVLATPNKKIPDGSLLE